MPAIFLIGWRGDGGVNDLLNLSQVVLAIQLPLAMFPLLWLTGSKRFMGPFRNGWFLTATGWSACLLITALDIYGLPSAWHDAMAIFLRH
jgi:manganese transport protein